MREFKKNTNNRQKKHANEQKNRKNGLQSDEIYDFWGKVRDHCA